MRFIVLGGAGDMGSRAVEDLVLTPGVEQVTIADRNVAAAERLAANMQGQGAAVDVRPVDANDHHALVQALQGYDVAASALGPFFLYESKLVRAAIEAGVDYASICDEWNATLDVLEQYADQARQAGCTVLIGLGTSPGISNVAVRYLADQLDTVHLVDVSVFQPLNAGGGEAVIRHMLFIISGQVATWQDGRQIMVPACSQERTVEFPQFGAMTVWNMGHAEPVTIPRFLPGVEHCSFFMGFGRGSGLFIEPAKRGFFQGRRRTNVAVRLLSWFEQLSAGADPAPGAVRVDVWGTLDGQEAHRMLCGMGIMREATGLSLSQGALMVARRELLTSGGGVYPPEASLDPQLFLTRLQDKGLQAYSDLAMTQRIG